MKILQLLERHDGSAPASVEYELEYQDADGGWDYKELIINGRIHTEHDPYNTGDSPAAVTFEPTEILDKATGEPVDPKLLTPDDWKIIQQKAHESTLN